MTQQKTKTKRAATALTDEERERLTFIAEHYHMTASGILRRLINGEYRRIAMMTYYTSI